MEDIYQSYGETIFLLYILIQTLPYVTVCGKYEENVKGMIIY